MLRGIVCGTYWFLRHFFHKNKLKAADACGVMYTVGMYVNPLSVMNLKEINISIFIADDSIT